MFCQNKVVKNNYTFVNSFLVVKKNCAVLHINLELKPETASRKKKLKMFPQSKLIKLSNLFSFLI